MSKTVEFYSISAAPPAYLAWTQLPKIAARTGARDRLPPMLLGGVFQATGNASPGGCAGQGPVDARTTCSASPGATACRSTATRTSRSTRCTLMRGAAGLHATTRRFMAYVRCGLRRACGREPKNMNDPAELGAGAAPGRLRARRVPRARRARRRQGPAEGRRRRRRWRAACSARRPSSSARRCSSARTAWISFEEALAIWRQLEI